MFTWKRHVVWDRAKSTNTTSMKGDWQKTDNGLARGDPHLSSPPRIPHAPYLVPDHSESPYKRESGLTRHYYIFNSALIDPVITRFSLIFNLVCLSKGQITIKQWKTHLIIYSSLGCTNIYLNKYDDSKSNASTEGYDQKWKGRFH